MDYKTAPIGGLIEGTIRQLIADLNDVADPADKEKLAAAIKHLQQALNDGLSGGASDDPLNRLVDSILNKTNETEPN